LEDSDRFSVEGSEERGAMTEARASRLAGSAEGSMEREDILDACTWWLPGSAEGSEEREEMPVSSEVRLPGELMKWLAGPGLEGGAL
jgi:hypothetical protein